MPRRSFDSFSEAELLCHHLKQIATQGAITKIDIYQHASGAHLLSSTAISFGPDFLFVEGRSFSLSQLRHFQAKDEDLSFYFESTPIKSIWNI